MGLIAVACPKKMGWEWRGGGGGARMPKRTGEALSHKKITLCLELCTTPYHPKKTHITTIHADTISML